MTIANNISDFVPKPARVALALGCAMALMVGCNKSRTPIKALTYPKTDTTDSATVYASSNGPVTVADPFRWLENDTSPATKAWVKAQNEVTFGLLKEIPFRDAIKASIEKNLSFARYSIPDVVGGKVLLYERNEGQQNQSVIYVQDGEGGSPEVLIDPNKLSADGTTTIGFAGDSPDSTKYGFVMNRAGSDWATIKIMDAKTRKFLPDSIEWVKFSGISMNKTGFYYSAYDKPVPGKELSNINTNHKCYFHKFGTSQSADVLVYQDAANPQRYHGIGISEDQQHEYLYVSQGTYGSEIRYRKAGKVNAPFSVLCRGFDNNYSPMGNVGNMQYMLTDNQAPNKRIVAIDPAKPEPENWTVIIPAGQTPIESATMAGGKIFVNYMVDVTSKVVQYDLTGKQEREVKLPDLGTATGFAGKKDAKTIYYQFTSQLYPRTVLGYDIETGNSKVLFEPKLDFDKTAFETKRVFVTSKDGTKIPLFITHRKGLELNGTNPTLLYAYGGFNVSLQPAFSAISLAKLKMGMVLATACLRGGGEYGEEWHKAGMLTNKQNVFDDFVACAQYLGAEKYTSPERLAIAGGSNGGLLVGAVMTQHPEICKVAFPEVGVLDMLRYHKFTVGWGWIVEYGNPDEPRYFDYIRKYSPLHNIRKGTKYPATMVVTADHDDRVVPAHSFKFISELQRCQAGVNPVVIRIDTQAGHGGSSLGKAVDLEADKLAFLFFNMGIDPEIK